MRGARILKGGKAQRHMTAYSGLISGGGPYPGKIYNWVVSDAFSRLVLPLKYQGGTPLIIIMISDVSNDIFWCATNWIIMQKTRPSYAVR